MIEKPDASVASLKTQARSQLHLSLVSAEQSSDETFRGKFTKKRKKKDDPLPEEQMKIEAEWNAEINKRYAKANALLDKAKAMLEKSQSKQVSVH